MMTDDHPMCCPVSFAIVYYHGIPTVIAKQTNDFTAYRIATSHQDSSNTVFKRDATSDKTDFVAELI